MVGNTDVVVIGGGLAGSMAAIMLARRGLSTVVLESRPAGKEQKVVIGEALTEGTSVFLRHEIGLTDWLKENAFREFGFDFLTLAARRSHRHPPPKALPRAALLSLTPFEKWPARFRG